MLTHDIAVIRGDGIGPEVTAEGLKLLKLIEAAGCAGFTLRELPVGAERFGQTGVALTDEELALLAGADAIYFGAIGDPRIQDPAYARDILLRLRFELDLYVNLRPLKLYVPYLSPLKSEAPLDLVIVRENTEGLYVQVGGTFKQGTLDEVAVQQEINTRKGVERILRFAFTKAASEGRSLVMSDKSNAMSYGHGLWQRVFAQLKGEYPAVLARHRYIDVLAMQLITQPQDFSLIVANNLFGDILADQAAGLVGGLGLSPSANFNPETGQALFEPVHGSAPDIAGAGIANPIAAILSLKLMLEHLGYPELGQAVESAVVKLLEGDCLPRDLGGTATTGEVGDRIMGHLNQLL